MAKKKEEKKEELVLNVPEDFVGEVIGTISKGSGEVAPLTRDFHNEELNLLRDKINEIIAK
jgi:predicted membrane GTPase involved in stress response